MTIKRIWVSPKFAEKIKINAAKKNKSIIDYTRELAEEEEKVSNMKIKPINKNFWRIL